jgi:hypothetical protein
MRAVVAQLYEDGGRPLARHRAVTQQPHHAGEFTLTEEHDRELRRSVRSAYLRDPTTGAEVLPRLRDAVVLWVGEGAWTVAGFETDPLTRKAVAQSWYVVMGHQA